MRNQTLILLSFLFFLVVLSACKPPQEKKTETPPPTKSTSEYITAENYLELHPAEKAISQSFNSAVQAAAQRLPAATQTKSVKIAFVYPGEQASDYWRRSLKSFVERMTEIGIQHEVHEFFSKGGGVETRKQELQLKQALELDPDYLVFTLDVNQHLRAIERILANKRPILILQNITTPLSIWEGNQPFYVGFDHAIGSRMLADYFLDNAPKDGSFGLLYYSKGYVSTMRGDTFREFILKGNGPALADSYYTAGKRDLARKNALKLLEREDLKFIYNCATDVALGAVDALKERGKTGQILVNGWGGGSAELTALLAGELDVTVMRMNDDNGVAMAEIVRLQLLGRANEIPTVFSGEFRIVTRNTTKSEIEQLTTRAFRYSGSDSGM